MADTWRLIPQPTLWWSRTLMLEIPRGSKALGPDEGTQSLVTQSSQTVAYEAPTTLLVASATVKVKYGEEKWVPVQQTETGVSPGSTWVSDTFTMEEDDPIHEEEGLRVLHGHTKPGEPTTRVLVRGTREGDAHLRKGSVVAVRRPASDQEEEFYKLHVEMQEEAARGVDAHQQAVKAQREEQMKLDGGNEKEEEWETTVFLFRKAGGKVLLLVGRRTMPPGEGMYAAISGKKLEGKTESESAASSRLVSTA